LIGAATISTPLGTPKAGLSGDLVWMDPWCEEMPEANPGSGMGIQLGSFGQTWNRRHQRHGHAFQGHYKSIPAIGEQASDPLQFWVPIDAAMGHNRSVGHLIRQGDSNTT